jgi:hypothetical protein
MSLVVPIIALFLGNGSRQRAETLTRHVHIDRGQAGLAAAGSAELCFWSLLRRGEL